jgi:YD repeat-containing protein
MTTTDEVGRKQRMTHDPLGRVVKAEIRKLNGSEWETYSTTTNTYNVRDQLTNVKEQVGETGAEQNTVLSYDGHGRLATRQRPIESGPSSYLYNADDTLQTMTDPRGVVTTYSYNNRHLVTNIAYSGGGSGVVALDADTFSYDDAGNRTAMANGVVSKSFVYNQQSQMISETHQFNGLAQAHMLQYEYNLAGQVKKVTDPWDNSVSYAFDKAGDVTAITGTGFADINQWTNRAVSQFASTVKYRAWGGLKSFSNGNFATEKTNFAFNYDERLQMTRFDAGGTLITNHNYYADGRAKDVLKDASSVLDFDRHYGYDHAARLTSATTGNSQPGTTPYHLTYAYDVWGNTTSRTGYHWGQGLTSFAPTYNNNRHTGWTYDAAGNVTDNSGPNVQNPAMKYDAAGRLANFINGAFFAYLNEHGYDGDSQRVHYSSTLINSSPVQSTRSYYLRSSVLGGEIIAEVYESNLWTESNGTKSYIYLNGERLAYQKNAHQAGADKEVVWVYRHPVTNSLYGHNRLNINGQPQDWIHDYTLTDPTGGEVFPYDPGTLPAPENPSLGLVMWGFLDDYGDCYADGVRTPCSLVMNWLERGWAAEAPWGETGLIWDSRTQVWQSPGGFVVDWDNGFFGFVPQGATYGGDGTWSWNAPSSGGGGRRRIGQSRGASVYDDEEADGRLSPQEPRVLPQVPQRHVPLVLPAPPLTPPREYDPRCAINPVTGQPGFTRDPRGVPGNLRPGQGGQGFFRAPRTRRDGTTYPHEGLDISGRLPSLIYASREGVVTRVANDRGGYGNYITIDHLDGTTTRYAHNLINLVRAGTYVQQGRVIALLGQTGNASGQPRTEAHVHFEVRVNGILRDPALWLNLSCTGWQIRPPF